MCNKVLAEDSELCISAISKSGCREAKSSAGLLLTSDFFFFPGIITVLECAIECGVSRPCHGRLPLRLGDRTQNMGVVPDIVDLYPDAEFTVLF